MEEKLLQIINNYGVNCQQRKLQEEVFELQEAIIKAENPYEPIQNIEHIAEEIADVMVILSELKEFYHINGNDILKVMNKKIDRQLERIKNENSK